MNSNEKTPSALVRYAGAALAVIVSLLALFGFDQYIDYKIGRAFQDPDNVQRISTRVRPAVIFDSRGSIIADLGCADAITDIKVLCADGNTNHPTHITITPKRFLSQQPLLTSIDDNEYEITVNRGHLRDWEYSLSAMKTIERNEPDRFRLEIIGE